MRASGLGCTGLRRVLRSGRAVFTTAAIGAMMSVAWWAAAPAVEDIHAVLATGAAPTGGWTLDRLVVTIAAGALLVVVAVLAALVALNVAGAVVASRSARLDRLAARMSPRWLRHCVFACCGFALTAPALASTASAHDTGTDGASAQRSVARLDGLRLPDLPAAPPTHIVTVRPGDTLWAIAERGLPPESTDRAIATRVNVLYAANRQTIGADPNLIFPGQQLTTPGGAP